MRSLLLLCLLLLPGVASALSGPTTFDGEHPEAIAARLADRPQEHFTLREQRLSALAAIARCGKADPITADCVEPEVARIESWQSEDPELRAMLENLRGMQAAYAQAFKAMQIGRQSQRALDRLVRDHPDLGGVRLQRGIGGLYAPRIAGRWSQARQDFETLLAGDYDMSAEDRLFVTALHAAAALRTDRPEAAAGSLRVLETSGSPYWQAEAQRIRAGELP